MNDTGWLLASDPSIRWQVMRDLIAAPEREVGAERARVATEGWGKQLLDLQHPKNQWSDGSYKSLLQSPDGSACQVLHLLHDMGLDPASAESRRAIGSIRENVTQYEGGKPYFAGETEPCINGRILLEGAYFGEPNAALLDLLLSEQLEDGGWNCDAPKSRRSSFATTLCVLEGLLAYETAQGTDVRITQARARGEEYLLARRLFRSLTSDAVVNPEWTLFSYPNGWHYDILRALDYLRSTGRPPDSRISEAIGIVEKNRRADGRWPLQRVHKDVYPFDMGEAEGQPSRWISLRALCVLKWAEK